MKTTLTFGRNSQLVWALILPAFILLIPLLLVIEYVLPVFPDQEDWIIIAVTFIYMGLDIWFTLSWVKSITARVEITVLSDSVEFNFLKKNIFHRSDFTIRFNEIINIGEDYDKGFNFLYFETRHPSFSKFFVRAKENDPGFDTFSQNIFRLEKEFNEQISADKEVTNKTIYQKWPMKLLAFLLFASWVVFPIVMLYQGANWIIISKYLVFVVISSPVILKVYLHNFGRQVSRKDAKTQRD